MTTQRGSRPAPRPPHRPSDINVLEHVQPALLGQQDKSRQPRPETREEALHVRFPRPARAQLHPPPLAPARVHRLELCEGKAWALTARRQTSSSGRRSPKKSSNGAPSSQPASTRPAGRAGEPRRGTRRPVGERLTFGTYASHAGARPGAGPSRSPPAGGRGTRSQPARAGRSGCSRKPSTPHLLEELPDASASSPHRRAPPTRLKRREQGLALRWFDVDPPAHHAGAEPPRRCPPCDLLDLAGDLRLLVFEADDSTAILSPRGSSGRGNWSPVGHLVGIGDRHARAAPARNCSTARLSGRAPRGAGEKPFSIRNLDR